MRRSNDGHHNEVSSASEHLVRQPFAHREIRGSGSEALIACVLCVIAAPAVFASEPDEALRPTVPAWARDARWYCDDVALWGDDSARRVKRDPQGMVRGDPRELLSRLPHLERLGINTLLLPYVPSDEDLAAFCRAAHSRAMRVVVSIGPNDGADAQRVKDLDHSAAWFDPNGDGDPGDGIDGVFCDRTDFAALMAVLEHHDESLAKKAAVRTLWLAPPHPEEAIPTSSAEGGATISYVVGLATRSFFFRLNADYTLEKFFDDLLAFRDRHPLDVQLAMVSQMNVPGRERLPFGGATRPREDGDKSTTFENDRDKLRLATVFQYFFLGAPLTCSGDEAGLPEPGDHGADGTKQAEAEDAEGNDYFELLRLLENRRKEHEPLRHGDFRPVMLDDERKILAFARTLPGDEVIVVINYGPDKHRIKIPVSWPRQLVGLLSLQIRPTERGGGHFRVAGARQQADQWGDVLMWMKPMSVRLVLVNDDEPR